MLTSKYAEHTPLYRQSEIYGRQGVELSRSLLSGWVDACCRQLSPLEEALHGYVLTDGKLHADDTPVPVLLPGNKKTKTGRPVGLTTRPCSARCVKPAPANRSPNHSPAMKNGCCRQRHAARNVEAR
ncbi:transposase [Escherichia coli]|nr:transposase [Escherichia coli]